MESPVNRRPTTQKCRWVFTYHNYERDINYRNYFRNPNFNIKRIVWGYEFSLLNNTPHLQGYTEFNRSVRLGFVRRILPNAHWEGATGTPTANYLYCTKGKNFETIGDFSKEASCPTESKKLSNISIIKGLLNEKTALQTMLSKEYACQHIYFDKIVRKIKNIRISYELHEEWAKKRLRVWQFKILERVLRQEERSVLWLYDANGNNGKSYLANYLSILYSFQLFDGQVNARDLAGMLDINASGICFDVCRAAENALDYNAIECLKNGCMSSGKYTGKCLRFQPMKIIVLSNFYPDCTKLSQDRWDILTVGEGILANMDEEAIVLPAERYPFSVQPPQIDLSTTFNLKQYLVDNGILDAQFGDLSDSQVHINSFRSGIHSLSSSSPNGK